MRIVHDIEIRDRREARLCAGAFWYAAQICHSQSTVSLNAMSLSMALIGTSQGLCRAWQLTREGGLQAEHVVPSLYRFNPSALARRVVFKCVPGKFQKLITQY